MERAEEGMNTQERREKAGVKARAVTLSVSGSCVDYAGSGFFWIPVFCIQRHAGMTWGTSPCVNPRTPLLGHGWLQVEFSSHTGAGRIFWTPVSDIGAGMWRSHRSETPRWLACTFVVRLIPCLEFQFVARDNREHASKTSTPTRRMVTFGASHHSTPRVRAAAPVWDLVNLGEKARA